jgi:hypothetical protein
MSVVFDEVSVQVEDRGRQRADRAAAERDRATRDRTPDPHLVRRTRREVEERDARLRAH